jgi:hypothetical protein
VNTGDKAPKRDRESVWAKLLRRAADVARLAGSVLQAVYYGLKIW